MKLPKRLLRMSARVRSPEALSSATERGAQHLHLLRASGSGRLL